MIPRMSISCERTVLCRGKKFDFASVRFRAPSGESVEKQYVAHPGAVVVVPVLEGGRVVLIRNFRGATGEWEWEFPAGTLDRAGEPPVECARRELVEETGYEAERMTFLGKYHTTPGLSDELMRAFVGEGLREVGQELEAGEMIDVAVKPVREAWEMVDRGELRDGKSITALFLASARGHVEGPGRFRAEARGHGA